MKKKYEKILNSIIYELEALKIEIDYKEDQENIIEELRLVINKIYSERGNVKEVIKMSQILDKYIVAEQKKRLKSVQKENIKSF